MNFIWALKVFLLLWVFWAGLNLFVTMFLPVRYLLPGGGAYVSGLWWNQRIVIRDLSYTPMSPEEMKAIIAHEQGHVALKHLIENLLVVIFLPFVIPLRDERRQQQELEADDYAAIRGHALFLASAIRKLAEGNLHPFDLYRAERLETLNSMQRDATWPR